MRRIKDLSRGPSRTAFYLLVERLKQEYRHLQNNMPVDEHQDRKPLIKTPETLPAAAAEAVKRLSTEAECNEDLLQAGMPGTEGSHGHAVQPFRPNESFEKRPVPVRMSEVRSHLRFPLILEKRKNRKAAANQKAPPQKVLEKEGGAAEEKAREEAGQEEVARMGSLGVPSPTKQSNMQVPRSALLPTCPTQRRPRTEDTIRALYYYFSCGLSVWG